jgi:hypothetical protein
MIKSKFALIFHPFDIPLSDIFFTPQIFARRFGDGIHHRISHRLQSMASRISTALLKSTPKAVKFNPFVYFNNTKKITSERVRKSLNGEEGKSCE